VIGLAQMMINLATQRAYGTLLPTYASPFKGKYWKPASREASQSFPAPVSREYYAILDRIDRGEKP
jgi:hypothetical protein